MQLFSDDGEVFRVKKSSQSRRLMKQKKAEKKRNKFGQIDEDSNENNDQNGDQIEKSQDPKVQVIPFQDLEIKVRDNITRKEAPSRYRY